MNCQRFTIGALVFAFAAGFGVAILLPPTPEPAEWQAPAALRPAVPNGERSKLTAKVRKLDPPEAENEVAAYLSKAIREIARESPADAIITANRYASGIALARLYRTIAESWAQADPAAAIAWCRQLGADMRSEALEGAVRGVAKINPSDALALVEAIPPDERSSGSTEAAVTAILDSGDFQRSSALFAHSDDELRHQAWLTLAQFGKHHPEAALALLADTPDEIPDYRVEHLILTINAEAFPEQTLSELIAADDFPGRSQFVQSAMESLAKSDLSLALQVHGNLPEEMQKRNGVDLMLGQYLEKSYGHRFASTPAELASLEGLVDAAFAGSPPAAVLATVLDYARSAEDTSRIARRIIESARDPDIADPQFALESAFVQLRFANPALGRTLATGIFEGARSEQSSVTGPLLKAAAGSLMRTEPELVVKLTEQVADPDLARVATFIALDSRLAADPVGASQWATTLPPGALSNSSKSRLAAAMSTRDPTASLTWALQLEKPDAQNQRLAATLRAWNVVDPDAAGNATSALGLSEERVAKLLGMIGEN